MRRNFHLNKHKVGFSLRTDSKVRATLYYNNETVPQARKYSLLDSFHLNGHRVSPVPVSGSIDKDTRPSGLSSPPRALVLYYTVVSAVVLKVIVALPESCHRSTNPLFTGVGFIHTTRHLLYTRLCKHQTFTLGVKVWKDVFNLNYNFFICNPWMIPTRTNF